MAGWFDTVAWEERCADLEWQSLVTYSATVARHCSVPTYHLRNGPMSQVRK